MNTAVIELDALPDPVGPRPEDDDGRAPDRGDLGRVLVGRVVVRRTGLELRGARVDRLEHRNNPFRPASGTDVVFGAAPQPGQLRIGETEALHASPVPAVERGRPGLGDEIEAFLGDLGDLIEEPWVDARDLSQTIDRDAPAQGRFELEGAVRRRDGGAANELVVVEVIEADLGRIAVEPEPSVLEGPERLLQTLRERATDGHRLADRLHPRAQYVSLARELLEGPARHFGDDVVDRRFEARRRRPGDVVDDLVKAVPDGQPRRDLGDREAGRLRRQGRAPADARVHLDDDHLASLRGDAELDVVCPRTRA